MGINKSNGGGKKEPACYSEILGCLGVRKAMVVTPELGDGGGWR